MKKLSLLGFCLLPILVSAQMTYDIQTGRELGIIGAAAGLTGYAAYVNARNDIIRPEEITALDPDRLWKIDRWVITQYSASAKKGSDLALYSSFLLPLTLLTDENGRQEFGKVGLMTLQTILLNSSVTNATKVTFRRPRPFLYNQDIALNMKLRKSDRYSFFSGHTSTTAALSFMTAKMHSDFNPDRNNSLVWALAAAVPAYTGIQRMRAGKHFLTDVLLGYAVGATIGILVPSLHR